MPVTVIVNMRTVVHKTSGGIVTCFPDVCKTPTPAGPIPIPYPNIAMASDTDQGSKKVKIDGNPIMLESSNFKMSTGDEPGSALGIVSSKIKGKAYPLMYSFDVKVEGKAVFRMLDIMLCNGASPTNTPPFPLLQAPLVVLPPIFKDPKLKSVKWSETEKKCGDEVQIEVKTSDYDDGDLVLVSAARGDTFVALFIEPVSGNSATIDWVTRTGPNPRGDVDIDLEAYGAGDPVSSSSALKIVVPHEAIQAGSKLSRRVPKMSQVPNPAGGSNWVPAGGNWGWNYGFELEIKEGVFHVTGKIKLVGQSGLVIRDKHKRAWKQEIEGIWTRKWKEHRENCQRGDDCNCWGGCCLFPIEVHCEFVDSGEYAVVNVWPGSPDTYGRPGGRHQKWWNSATWFMQRCGHEGNADGVRAHEFGHAIGLYDEYSTGAVYVPQDASGAVTGPPPYPNVPGSLMGPNGTSINENHLNEFHDWFISQAPDAYKRLRM